MNLPAGEVVEQNLVLAQIDVRGLVSALVDKSFTGYIVNTILGFSGVEEGVLLFKKGFLVGSFFEYLNFDKPVFGNSAVSHVFNSLSAQNGVVDIVGLSGQQVDLVTAFNDRVGVTVGFKKSELLGLIRPDYVASFAQQTLTNVKPTGESRQSVLKRYGLSELR